MSKSLDDKVIKDPETNLYLYDTTTELRALPDILSEYHTTKYSNTISLESLESIRKEIDEFFEMNNQEIIANDVIVYDEDLGIADEINVVTRRSYEDAKGIPQTNYYFYNYVNYPDGLKYYGEVTDDHKYGNMKLPFKYLKNSSYYAESLRMALIAALGGLGDTVHGQFMLDPNGKELVVPTFPMKAWFEDSETIHARYPRFSDGKIYNTKKIGIEHTYLL